MAMEDRRINKYLADSGFCSRREADRLVEQGKVRINGQPARIGDRVQPSEIGRASCRERV